MVALVTIAENTNPPTHKIAANIIREDMNRAGFTKIAETMSLTSLLQKGMIEAGKDTNEYMNQFVVYAVSKKGTEWLFENENRLILKNQGSEIESQDKIPDQEYTGSEDIPF